MRRREEPRPRIRSYSLEPDVIPDPEAPEQWREVLKLTLRGDYFHRGATPIFVSVGDVEALPFETDGTTLICYLLSEPPEGARIVVIQGDLVMVAPQPFSRERLRRPRTGGG